MREKKPKAERRRNGQKERRKMPIGKMTTRMLQGRRKERYIERFSDVELIYLSYVSLFALLIVQSSLVQLSFIFFIFNLS